MFLSLILWFVFDEERSLTVYVDGNRIYSVTEVIDGSVIPINEECEIENELDFEDARES